MLIDLVVDIAVIAVTGPMVVATVVVLTFAATRVARLVIRRVIRHLARRSLTVPAAPGMSGLWRPRALRVGVESGEMHEQRRRQRIDAASRMVSHLASVAIWIVAAILLFHLLDVDPAFFLSSAGFIGAALAIGGQHKVNDYLTGLSVHFEDRYGVGDEIVAEVGWAEPVQGVVDHVGLFSTRVRDRRSTLHFPNHALTSVRNLSQQAPASTLRVLMPDESDAAEAAAVLRDLAGSEGHTDVVFVGDLDARETGDGHAEIEFSTSRSLDGRTRERLARRVEREIRRP